MRETIKIVVDDRKLVALMKATKGKRPTRIIADGVEYGIYIEMGTVHMPARPCAGPAVEAVRPAFLQAWKKAGSLARSEAVVDKAAHDVERLWKQNIIQKDAVDTGAYLNSIHVVDAETFTTEFESMRP